MNYSKHAAFAAALVALIPAAIAKDKKSQESSKDEIQVAGHVALADGPVRRFLLTEHYSRVYLYAERDAGQAITLVDVTKASQPFVIADVNSVPADGSNLVLAAGTAALVSTAPAVNAQSVQTIRIMDLSDPKNPKIAREFTGVTAVARDDRRGLVYVANGEGIWILQQHLATDPDVIKAYDYQIRYGMSMYPPK